MQVAALDEQADRLRQALADLERQEVAQVLEQRARAETQAGAAGQPGRGELVDKPDGASSEGWRSRREKPHSEPVEPLTLGRGITEPLTPLREIVDEMRRVAVEGRVFGVESRTLPSGRRLVQFYLTDETDSITAKVFVQGERQQQALEPLTDGVYVRIQGQVQFDAYAKELVFLVSDMQPAQAPERLDTAAEKRVELHLHTTLSALDAVTPVADYIKQAARWGHKALAVTDHGVVQAFPEAYQAGRKHGVKILYGVEAYVVDDGTPLVYRPADVSLEDAEFVVFDTETTGLNAREDTLIELAAVRVRGGELVDTFATLIDPERPLPAKISELTGITQDMVDGQPKLVEALERFRALFADRQPSLPARQEPAGEPDAHRAREALATLASEAPTAPPGLVKAVERELETGARPVVRLPRPPAIALATLGATAAGFAIAVGLLAASDAAREWLRV
ncbi:MAG: PHP domain-containing protein, partial [Alicyclobacillus sp.]|nr:PHP domain-containing protein [Alicyclobacillus sp.]